MKRSLICLFVFFNMIILNGTIHSFEHQELLAPLPENPSMVGYLTDVKESMLSSITGGNELPFFLNFDVRLNLNPVTGIAAAGLGIPLNFKYVSFFAPFFVGGVTDFGGYSATGEGDSIILIKDGMSFLPPQGWFLSGGLFASSKYFHLGFISDRFYANERNRYTAGVFTNFKLYPRIYFDEIPYVGAILNMLDSFWSYEQFFESFSTETELDSFKSEYSDMVRFGEYNVNLQFEDFSLGNTAVTFSTYSHRKYYDKYAKADMQGVKLFFNFNHSFVLFADIAYRRYFDVILAPDYSDHKDGVYTKAGFLYFPGGSDLFGGYLQMYVESGRQPGFTSLKINLTFGFAAENVVTKFSGDQFLPNKLQGYSVNSAASLGMKFGEE